MKTIEINVTQERVATGQDQSGKTTANVYSFDEGRGDCTHHVWVQGWEENPQYRPSYGFNLIAQCVITHPWLMAGSREETLQDFARIVTRRLLADGILEEDSHGQIWVAESICV